MKKIMTSGLYDEEILEEFANSPLRVSVIVSVALMDRMLEELIKKSVVDDPKIVKKIFDDNKLFDTLYNKISYCYITGIISEELYNDMEIFRSIRNYCAHLPKLNDTAIQSIKGKIEKLSLVRTAFTGIENQTPDWQIRMGFMCIYIALVKKMARAKHVDKCLNEVHNLGFEKEDYEFMKQMSI